MATAPRWTGHWRATCRSRRRCASWNRRRRNQATSSSIVSDEYATACAVLGTLRVAIGAPPVSEGPHRYVWVVDFPMFEGVGADGHPQAAHHPFTMPYPEDLPLLETDPLAVRSQAYDLVLNGWELGSGSVRIHRRANAGAGVRRAGHQRREAEARFGFLLGAFRYGAPPHAGFAVGVDRLVAILAGEENIREVIAYPKTQSGADLLTGAPTPLPAAALAELGIRVVVPPPRRPRRPDPPGIGPARPRPDRAPLSLFADAADRRLQRQAPLAARLRPRTLDEVVGQEHLVGPGAPLRRLAESDRVGSSILWGPAGTGKTTLARLLADTTAKHLITLSATAAGVKDVREALAEAERRLGEQGQGTMLFIDEVHRFSKSQQDVLLPAVEDGLVVLIGATTENPFFEVNPPLLSRTSLWRLHALSPDNLRTLIRRGLDLEGADAEDGRDRRGGGGLRGRRPGGADDGRGGGGAGPQPTGGDADSDARVVLTMDDMARARDGRLFHQGADEHYDQISALIKSVRGSDPDAGLYWMARMIEAGEDPRFLARRMVILASEDIGLADPQALLVAEAAARAVEYVGLPEAALNLAEAVIYLARAPKSNAVVVALGRAQADVRSSVARRCPTHLRDAHYKGAATLGHGEGYVYPHDDPSGVVAQQYRPDALEGRVYYEPTPHGAEGGRRDRPETGRPIREPGTRGAGAAVLLRCPRWLWRSRSARVGPRRRAPASAPPPAPPSPGRRRRCRRPCPHVPAGATQYGSAPSDQVLNLDVAWPGRTPPGLAQAVAAVSTPGSPDYRHYLTPAQFAAQYGPSRPRWPRCPPSCAARASTVGTPEPGSTLLPVSGTASVVSAALRHAAGDGAGAGPAARAIVNTASPQVPASLDGVVTGVVGLDGLFQEHSMLKRGPSRRPAALGRDAPGTAELARGTSPRATTTPAAGQPAETPTPARPRPAPAPRAWPSAAPTPRRSWLASSGSTSSSRRGAPGSGRPSPSWSSSSTLPSDVAAFEACYGLSNPIRNVVVDGGRRGPPQGAARRRSISSWPPSTPRPPPSSSTRRPTATTRRPSTSSTGSPATTAPRSSPRAGATARRHARRRPADGERDLPAHGRCRARP